MKIIFSILLVQLLALPAWSQVKAKPGLKEIAHGFTAPIITTSLPDQSGRLVIVDQVGKAFLVSREGKMEETPFADLESRLVKLNQGFDERGVIGFTFHPRFSENRRAFVYYSAPKRKGSPPDWDHTSRIVEFKVNNNPVPSLDLTTEKVLLEVDQPYFNHNGGALAFGPDGYLYIALGDGGNGNDEGRGHAPRGNGQDTTTLLAKILRIDVDKGSPYAIPSDNPFKDGKGRPEIFAYGLRNPWTMSFDRGGKKELFAADVGQNLLEEINIIVKGGNYGWNVREGSLCFDPKNPSTPMTNCVAGGTDGKPFIAPIIEYKNFKGFPKEGAMGICVVGGYVYRGKTFPEMQGKYVFADWSRNWAKPDGVLFIAEQKDGAWSMAPLDVQTHPGGQVGAYVWALGEDAEGELYVMTNDSNTLVGKTGKVFKLVRHE